ncbi:peptidylprolyl isomerase [Streptomyces sp. 7-21]|uniref:peptidylprolyl isomerase n=1 Tax=Streptomyces sp. 7-21 TaxID=2802283 RepID=UPI00191D7B4C|nr:peptidylprolyl isomerase [Streptomyces sp. 7-21]MBL1067291.1 peptidylprolyl isomerase [Streptomyces sp. 7-21]
MSTKKQRRKQLARAKWERQRQRQALRARRARRRNIIIAVVLVVAIAAGGTALAALSGGDSSEPDTDAAGEPAPEPPEDPCEQPAPGEPTGGQWDSEPEMTVNEESTYVMQLDTTCGAIEITMDAAAAPHTVNSFAFLAGENYFDHTPCHRLTTSGIFVLQCGDPQGTGMGGPGYTLPDENLGDPDIADGVYPAGTVAMANSGPDTGGSQFFLVYEDSQLPADYTPFGEVTAGMDVLQKIADAGSTEPDPQTGNTAPNATVVINEARVEEREAS